jgi:hypothetical protein
MPLEDFGNRIPQLTAEITRNPVPAAPYVNLSSDTSAAAPSTWTSGGTVDWTNDKFMKLVYDSATGKEYFVHYDMRTMNELYRVEVQKVAGGQNFADPHVDGPAENYPAFNPAFSIGGNYFFANTSLFNSGSGQIWDANTGAGLGRIGHPSNGFPANPLPDSSQPFYPEGALIGTWDATALWLRTLNEFGQSDILFHAGNLGSAAILWTPGRYPVHWMDFGGGSFGGAASWAVMRGKEVAPSLEEGTIGNSDLLFYKNIWNGTDWDVHLNILNLVDGAVMKQVSGSTAGPPFSMVNSPFNSETITSFPRPFAGEDFILDNWAYDKSDNGIVMWGRTGANNFGNGGTWRFVKYLLDEGTYLWAKKDTDLPSSLASTSYSAADMVGGPSHYAGTSNLDGGTVGWVRGTMLYTNPEVYVADLTSGNITLNLPSPLPNYTEGQWQMNSWDDATQSVMAAQPRIFVRAPGDGVSLQTIVDDVLGRTGALTYGVDWDSDQLADIKVHGYAISREATARDVLTQLAGAYFFEGVESDYIIKCVLRGQSPVANLTEKHLSWVENRDTTIKETRAQELELPMRVTVTYSDQDRDYQDGTQSAKRNTDPFPTMHSHNEVKIELPIAMTATEAKRIADKSIKMAWAGRWSYKVKLPWEFLKYDPTDVVTITKNNGTLYNVRLDKIDMGVDFSLDTSAIAEKATAYISTVVGATGTIPPKAINVGGPCDFFLLNTPMLRDADDSQGVVSYYYVSAKSQSPGDFIAAYIFEATDSTGTEYEDIDSVTTEPTWGIATSILPKHFDYAIDNKTVLTVRIASLAADLTPDILESCTYDELLAGTKNAAIVGDEIIQFMTATPIGDGQTYQLTGLLRARRGTSYATQNHAAGERFVMLVTDGSIKREMHEPDAWDKKHYFKAVATGTFAEDSFPVAADMEPNDLKPYTPEDVRLASDDGTNVTITFERRSRIGNELHDFDGTVPYKEGQGSLAHCVYKVYANKLLADKPWADGTAVAFTGNVALYSGVTLVSPLTFQFAKAGITKFVVELYEVGYVDGFKKYVQFVNIPGTTQWDKTDLY